MNETNKLFKMSSMLPVYFLKKCCDINIMNEHLEKFDRITLVGLSIGGTFTLMKILQLYQDNQDGVFTASKKYFFKTLKRVPWVKKKIDEELEKTMKDLRKDVNSQLKGISYHTELPRLIFDWKYLITFVHN